MAIKYDTQGFNENLDAAYKGGGATGKALVNFEKRTGVTVVSSDNFLGLKGGDTASELPEPKEDQAANRCQMKPKVREKD